ncbi:MAG: hypothetical protein NZM25_10120 [Leptospiraceae bacterium]|nr:hypothetical protein [Leptospiraceae bacterium]MDW8307505.1 hypothetical protein [Leptospiraceae bacterium]
MPARREINPKEALDHLKSIYELYLKEGRDPKRFTIRHYNRLNENSHYYIDVYVKKLGGWNHCLQKAGIPLGFRQYKEFGKEEVGQYVKKVYKIYLQESSKEARYKNQEKTFRMRDYVEYNPKAGNRFSLAVVLKRFGSWSNLCRELKIPVGRSRGLTQQQVIDHVMQVYDRFLKKEGPDAIFSKEMYDKYNFIDDVYISSKLVERRFGTWVAAKKQLKIK